MWTKSFVLCAKRDWFATYKYFWKKLKTKLLFFSFENSSFQKCLKLFCFLRFRDTKKKILKKRKKEKKPHFQIVFSFRTKIFEFYWSKNDKEGIKKTYFFQKKILKKPKVDKFLLLLCKTKLKKHRSFVKTGSTKNFEHVFRKIEYVLKINAER